MRLKRFSQRFGHDLFAAFLAGFTISCVLLVVTLLHMLNRYSKDLAEVMATWQYIGVLIVAACLSARLFWVIRPRPRPEV